METPVVSLSKGVRKRLLVLDQSRLVRSSMLRVQRTHEPGTRHLLAPEALCAPDIIRAFRRSKCPATSTGGAITIPMDDLARAKIFHLSNLPSTKKHVPIESANATVKIIHDGEVLKSVGVGALVGCAQFPHLLLLYTDPSAEGSLFERFDVGVAHGQRLFGEDRRRSFEICD